MVQKNASGMDLMEQEDGEKKNKKEGGEEEEAEVEEHVLLHTLPQNDKLRELADRKHLLYTLLGCLKTVLFGVAHYDRNQRQGEESGSMQGHQVSCLGGSRDSREESHL